MGSPGRSQGTARAAVQLYRAVSPDFGCTQTPRSFSHRCGGRAVQREGPRSWNSRLTWLLGCSSPGVDQGHFKGLSLSASVRRRDGARGNIFKNSKVNMPTWLEHPRVFCSALRPSELSVHSCDRITDPHLYTSLNLRKHARGTCSKPKSGECRFQSGVDRCFCESNKACQQTPLSFESIRRSVELSSYAYPEVFTFVQPCVNVSTSIPTDSRQQWCSSRSICM